MWGLTGHYPRTWPGMFGGVRELKLGICHCGCSNEAGSGGRVAVMDRGHPSSFVPHHCLHLREHEVHVQCRASHRHVPFYTQYTEEWSNLGLSVAMLDEV